MLGRYSALERIDWFILFMQERLGADDKFVLPMPRPDITDYLGLTVETLSRCLSRLRKMGVIYCGFETVQILDLAQLSSIMQGNLSYLGIDRYRN